jgi:hypothetical protein
VEGKATNSSGINYGGYFTANSIQGRGLYAEASATSGENYGGYFKSNSTNGGKAVYAIASGDESAAVYGKSINSSSAQNYGGYFEAEGSNSIGVYGSTNGGNNSLSYGGYFEATNNSSYGVGVEGISYSEEGIGARAYAEGEYGVGIQATANGKNSIAVRGITSDENGVGVYGTSSGQDGIGVEASGKSFDFYASGPGIDYGQASSRRWKKNITVIPEPLKMISKLRGVYYDWDKEHGGRNDIGMIAEEVGKVLPEIVQYEKNGIDAIGMDYSKLTPLLVESVKAQQEMIEKNEDLIDEIYKKLRLVKE